MLESSIPLLNVFGVAAVTFVGWFSRQIPRRARLIARLERLGAAYAAMPESPQKEKFKRHLLTSIEELDAWIEPSNVMRRTVLSFATTGLVVVGVFASLPIQAAINPTRDVWVSFAIGAVLGVVILALTSSLERVWRDRSNRREAAAEEEKQAAEDARRMAAIARGESPGPPAVTS